MNIQLSKIFRNASFGLSFLACFSTPAWSAERDWSDSMNFDHAGFSDGSALMTLGRFQVESGMEFTSETAVTNWLARFGLFDWMELRFEVPSIVTTYESPSVYQVDALESGVKIALYETEELQLSVLPYLMFPAGSIVSAAEVISPGLELLTDVSLVEDFTFSFGVYSRALGRRDALRENDVFTIDTTLATAITWSVTKQFGLVGDAWYTFQDLFGEASLSPTPGADVAVYYMFTPDLALDVYAGATFTADKTYSFGGFGLSARL